MTTSSLRSADGQQAPPRIAFLTTLVNRLGEGMIAAGCMFGAVSPSMLLRQRTAYLSSRPSGRWSR